MGIIKKPFFYFFLLLLVCWFLFMQNRKNSSSPASISTSPDKSVSPVGNETIVVPAENLSPTLASDKFMRPQKELMTLIAKGVIPIPIQLIGSNLRFTVKPMPVGYHCAAGDFDIMQVMASSDTAKIFAISIESMNKSGAKVSQAYSLADVRKKTVFPVTVPIEDNAYGLYLCIDSKQKKKCSDSPSLDRRTWGQTDKKTREMAEGRNLYFQLLVIRGGAAFLIPGARWGKQNLEKLTQDVGPWLGSLSKYLNNMNDQLEALSPLPAVVLGKDLSIPLKYIAGKCGQ